MPVPSSDGGGIHVLHCFPYFVVVKTGTGWI